MRDQEIKSQPEEILVVKLINWVLDMPIGSNVSSLQHFLERVQGSMKAPNGTTYIVGSNGFNI